MSLENVSRFWEWFDQTRGNISIREIERLSQSPRGRISNHYRKKIPTFDVCVSIARGLGILEEDVLKMAGLLPSGKTAEKSLSPNIMLEEIYQAVKAGQLHRLTDERVEYLIGGGSGDDPTFKELLEFARRLSREERLQLIQYAAFLESQRRSDSSATPATAGA